MEKMKYYDLGKIRPLVLFIVLLEYSGRNEVQVKEFSGSGGDNKTTVSIKKERHRISRSTGERDVHLCSREKGEGMEHRCSGT